MHDHEDERRKKKSWKQSIIPDKDGNHSETNNSSWKNPSLKWQQLFWENYSKQIVNVSGGDVLSAGKKSRELKTIASAKILAEKSFQLQVQ